MTRLFPRFGLGFLVFSLSGCNLAAMGPDLAKRPTPLIDRGIIRITEPDQAIDVTVTADPGGDRATVVFAPLGKEPYQGDLTFQAFSPRVAETIADRHDYWLVAANLSQTRDRSFYAILRYPHGKPLQPHSVRKDFELRLLTCDGASKPPAEEASVDDKGIEHTTPVPLGYARNDTNCVFPAVSAAIDFAGESLQKDEQVARDALAKKDEDDQNPWLKLEVSTQ
jgi:hypothetical protein